MLKDWLEQPSQGDSTMTHQFLKLAAAGAIVALTAASTPARAGEMVQNLGPVGPNQTILATFGNKRVIAFYQRDNGRCAVNAVVFEKTDAETGMTTAARVRIGLTPRATLHLDSSDNQTLHLQCGDDAKTLAVVDNDVQIASQY
jgi:hypothetical protein